ncbi:hypothetical protein LSH36_132g05056 [Paralvinella palmiformis]|uniref:CDGSH iron-sulfur domain-containing protein 2 homologue n=1 Tax=Paralvinella palmiformis TaxID=53620 RepID=A0AAD9JW96_9ANNE|nr:hypothetical protein LSH36_132g05056 [Paralvinella palmiformis]
METVATLVKVTLPSYLANLTIPTSVDELASISGPDWVQLIIFMLTIAIIFYSLIRLFHPSVDKGPKGKGHPINPSIRKECPKVVDVLDVEDLNKEKVSYCRCWKSKKFPLCDGSHNAHNEETGDNVGPVVIRKKIN